MGTLDDRQAALEARLEAIQTAITAVLTGGEDNSLDGMRQRSVSLSDLRKLEYQTIRSLQRLGYGGRMLGVDVSGAQPVSNPNQTPIS